MKQILISTFTTAMLVGMSFAQTSAQAQASGSASENSAVSASQSGAQAQSQTGAQAATQGELSGKSTSSSAAASQSLSSQSSSTQSVSGKSAASNTAASKAGSQSAQAAGSSQLASGSTIHATLVKPVDARKNKAGDEVIAKNTQDVKSNGQVIVPKGCKLIGHVTEAKAKGKGEAQSTMGIAFDRAVLKDGREVPMTASIQAIASAQQSAAAATSDDSMMADGAASGMASSGGTIAGRGTAPGVVGGAGRAIGTTGGALVNTAGSATGGTLQGVGSGASATGALSSTSRGVVGMNGMQLSSVASNSRQGSVITCAQHNVHLDSGTQMILLVSGK